MGRYLALTMHITAGPPPSRVLAGVFSGAPFVPVGLGAVSTRGRANHWLLSGFAVEDFVERFARRRKAATVHVPAGAGAEREYLAGVAAAARAGRLPDAPGPFERRDDGAGATFVDGVAMGPDALAALDGWSAGTWPDAVHLYGAFPLAVREPDGHPWHRAFRCLPGGPEPRGLPAPLLFLRAGVSPFDPGTREVLVFTQARVWLRAGNAIGGRVGPAEADENLRNLAATVAAAAASAGGALRSVTLDVDGAGFADERPRLMNVFSAVPGFTDAR